MLAGIYIKNFKCYQGTIFIPVFSDKTNKFVGYLGDNGVGKSAILEALGVFFSSKPQWLRNKDAHAGAQNCFVAPVFILEKEKIQQDLSRLQKNIVADLPDLVFDREKMVAVCVARREDGLFTLFDGKKELSNDKDQKIFQISFVKTYCLGALASFRNNFCICFWPFFAGRRRGSSTSIA